MMFRKLQGPISAMATAALGVLCNAAHADSAVLTGSYSWEDGQATMFSIDGNAENPVNIGPDGGVSPYDGNRMLRVSQINTSGTPQVKIAFIENLQDGDIVVVETALYDDTPAGQPRMRLWANYADSGDPNSVRGQIGGESQAYTSGIGWEKMSDTWTFDSNNGQRDALMIQVRLYTNVPADFYIDDITVKVYCATNPDLRISFPDGSWFDDPAAPGPECESGEPGQPCTPTPLGSYGWEDEVGTAFHTVGNITELENTTTYNGISPVSGDRMLRIGRGSGSAAQVWVAFVENLEDGDEIYASFYTYDDTPDTSPSVRIWGHYAAAGDPLSSKGSAHGNETYSSGIGWELIDHTWVFDSNNGDRTALMIEARLYTVAGVEHTDFFLDDIYVAVCSNNPNVKVTFPTEMPSPGGPCDMPNGAPTLAADFGWEDGQSTILGHDDAGNGNLSAANVDELVNSGNRALRVTEAPHVAGHTPRVFLGFVENLQDGDVIHGRFHAFDDTPGSSPSVRIYGRRAFSGDINSGGWSAGGAEEYTSGNGWEAICHTWVYDSGPQNSDALIIEARIYSTPSDCPQCSTDYYFDDMEIHVWGNPNATITLPDGTVIGEPPLNCPADINNNGSVDIFDLFAALGTWGTSDAQADINKDGLVDGADLGLLLAAWGPCEVPYLAPKQGNVDLVVDTTPLRSGMKRHDIYVQLNDADDTLVNVYDANVTLSTTFDFSSYYAIGQQHNDVWPDPNFDTFEFHFGLGLGANAGWYNENPSNGVGRAGLYANNRVLILSLTIEDGESAAGTLSVTYEDADGRPIYATASFDTDEVPSTCIGDVNGDNTVDISDMMAVLNAWGTCDGCPADINGDGSVDIADMMAVLSAWGACPN